MQKSLESIKAFLERTTPLGILAQRRRQKRGKNRPTSVRIEEKGFPPLPTPRFRNPENARYFKEKFRPCTCRLDYIIIWGHGLKYRNEIIEMISDHPGFNVIKFLYHKPTSISKLIKAVYSYDYAPLNHLKSKTKYLKRTPKQVLFIFFENNDANEDYFGKGIFRHYESATLKSFKENIRNKFNDRVNGHRTEDHVIHASDNALQTHYILQYLGFTGLEYLGVKSSVIDVPYYINVNKGFTVKTVPIESLVCNFVTGSPNNPKKVRRISIKKSPQYRGLVEGSDVYNAYINEHFEISDYSWEKYLAMAKDFKYLADPYNRCYIVTRQLDDGRFLIHDGLHRASILAHKGFSEITVAVLRSDNA